MSVDDQKHTEIVNIRLTEREFLDSAREAMRADRKHSEWIRSVLRQHMYGIVLPSEQKSERT